MRHILHEILARYLNTDQYAFEPTPREFWPAQARSDGRAAYDAEPEASDGYYGELEPQS
jgi:hypothetical protein